MFKELLEGNEWSVMQLSNVLIEEGCEDICDFGNWEELLNDGNVVVATDENREELIQVFFDVIIKAEEDEVIEASIIRINDVIEF